MKRQQQISASVTTGALADVGHIRTDQQDSWGYVNFPLGNRVPQLALRKGHLYVVADGVGGEEDGGLASGIAVQAIIEAFYSDPTTDIEDSLRNAIMKAHQRIFEQSQKRDSDMQTTVVCAVICGQTLYVAHAGDSRAYLMRSSQLIQLTTDHSHVQALVEAGKLTQEEARTHPARNVIIRSLGSDKQVEAQISRYEIHSGDIVLLCSDGLHGELHDKEIKGLILANPEPQTACEELVKQAKKAGGEDNISLIVTRVDAFERMTSRLINRILPLRVHQPEIKKFTSTGLAPAARYDLKSSRAKEPWWQRKPPVWVIGIIAIIFVVLVTFQTIWFQSKTDSLQTDLHNTQQILLETGRRLEDFKTEYEQGQYGYVSRDVLQELEEINRELPHQPVLVIPANTPLVIPDSTAPNVTNTPFNQE